MLGLLLGDMFKPRGILHRRAVVAPKARTPLGRLDEAMEYLVQNRFDKMGYLKNLTAQPLKEFRPSFAAMTSPRRRCSPIPGQQPAGARRSANLPSTLLEEEPPGGPERNAGKAQSSASLRMAGRRGAYAGGAPFGARRDRAVVGREPLEIDKVYEAITTSAKRRKIAVIKRETSDRRRSMPRAPSVRSVRRDGAGRRGRAAFLHSSRLKGWQEALNGYKSLADGKLSRRRADCQRPDPHLPLLDDTDSRKFIERFNALKDDLLAFGDTVPASGATSTPTKGRPGKPA